MSTIEYTGRPKLFIKYILNNQSHHTDTFPPQDLVKTVKTLKSQGVIHFTIHFTEVAFQTIKNV